MRGTLAAELEAGDQLDELLVLYDVDDDTVCERTVHLPPYQQLHVHDVDNDGIDEIVVVTH